MSSHGVNPKSPTLEKHISSHIKEALDDVKLENPDDDGVTKVLKNLNIDIVIFGRAGTGKSTLLRALTGRNDIKISHDGSHGTTEISYYEVPVSVGDEKYKIRYWDTKGIEKWDADFINTVIDQLKSRDVKPIAVIFTTTIGGRDDIDFVNQVLVNYVNDGVHFSYVVTRMTDLSQEEYDGFKEQGMSVMTEVCGPHTNEGDHYWRFGKLGFFGFINSIRVKKITSVFHDPLINVDELMTCVADSLDKEALQKFFLATLENRSWWEKFGDQFLPRIKSFVIKVEKFIVIAYSWLNDLFQRIGI